MADHHYEEARISLEMARSLHALDSDAHDAHQDARVAQTRLVLADAQVKATLALVDATEKQTRAIVACHNSEPSVSGVNEDDYK